MEVTSNVEGTMAVTKFQDVHFTSQLEQPVKYIESFTSQVKTFYSGAPVFYALDRALSFHDRLPLYAVVARTPGLKDLIWWSSRQEGLGSSTQGAVEGDARRSKGWSSQQIRISGCIRLAIERLSTLKKVNKSNQKPKTLADSTSSEDESDDGV